MSREEQAIQAIQYLYDEGFIVAGYRDGEPALFLTTELSEAQEAIKNYIAACRNEYLRCKGLILAATTNDEADAVQFIPPSVPENL